MYLLSSKKMFPSLCVTIINPILCRKVNFYYKLSPTIHMTYCMKNVTESSDILWQSLTTMPWRGFMEIPKPAVHHAASVLMDKYSTPEEYNVS